MSEPSPATRERAAQPSPDEVAEFFRDSFKVLRGRQLAVLAKTGISLSEWSALHLCASGGVRAREIAETVGLTPAAVTDIIDRLEGRRLVHRARDPDDRRAVRIELTNAGRRQHGEIRRQMLRLWRAKLEELAPREYAALATGLRALAQLQGEPGHPPGAGV
jgi:DNA-binding MarR family transcriptional regulator